MTDSLPRLGVLHDFGALSTLEVIESAAGLCDIVWITKAGDEVDELLAVSGEVADCDYEFWSGGVDVTGLPRLDGVVAFSDRTLDVANGIATSQALVAHDESCLRAFTDKAVQRAALRRAGLVQPRTAQAANLAEARRALDDLGGGPVVVKPVASYGSKGTYRVDSAADLAVLDGREQIDWPAQVIEEFLQAKPATHPAIANYVCVESVISGGDITHVAISGKFRMKEPFLEMGCFTGAQLGTDAEAVAEEATRALQAVGVRDGVCHTEVMLCADGPRIIEVNGRVGGWSRWLTKRATGADLGRLAILAALGRPVESLLEASRNASPASRADAGPIAVPAAVHAFIFRDAPGPDGATVAGLPDPTRLRSLPGVERVDVLATVGERLDWLDLGAPHATAVWGAATTYEELQDLATVLFEEGTVAWAP